MRATDPNIGNQTPIRPGIAKIMNRGYVKEAIVACDGKLSPWGSIFLFTLLAPRKEFFRGFILFS
jgi:hypothetical protein